MHKIIKKVWLCALLVGVLVSSDGCSAKKEILLEHSIGTEESAAQEEDPSDVEEAEREAQDSESQEGLRQSGSVAQQEVLSETAVIYVYICGEVQDPGVYEMRPADRVYTLIDRAGGLTDEADEKAVNQADILTDGQMIYIPSTEETEGQSAVQAGTGSYGVRGSGQQEGTAADGQTDGKVNINTANLDELMTLPGIGESKAKNILSYRETHGTFGSIEEIMNVDGIKEGTYTKMKDRITV